MANQVHVLYVLGCDHVTLLAPSLIPKNQHPTCPICREGKPITGVHQFEWRGKCPTCKLTRWCGLSAEVANQIADAHYRSTGHLVDVSYARNPSAVKELERLAKAKLQ